ncbi:hypothetical protein HNY73_017663 [Argiope bruennichi]|uniref:Uncharacterized protein n=1 Tax=Argiope bruennichi TaxID=94029 RepID=A0A8T0EAG0_ARGBR|nr:hypothetical protein HNY73_017663 [Argiope bruennichi]
MSASRKRLGHVYCKHFHNYPEVLRARSITPKERLLSDSKGWPLQSIWISPVPAQYGEEIMPNKNALKTRGCNVGKFRALQIPKLTFLLGTRLDSKNEDFSGHFYHMSENLHANLQKDIRNFSSGSINVPKLGGLSCECYAWIDRQRVTRSRIDQLMKKPDIVCSPFIILSIDSSLAGLIRFNHPRQSIHCAAYACQT